LAVYTYLNGIAVDDNLIAKALRNIDREIEKRTLSFSNDYPKIIAIGQPKVWTLHDIKKEILNKTKIGLEQAIIWGMDV